MFIAIGYALLDDENGDSTIIAHFLSPAVMDVIENRLYPTLDDARRALQRGGPFTNPAHCSQKHDQEAVFMYVWYPRHMGGSGKAYWWVAMICQTCCAVLDSDNDNEIMNLTCGQEVLDALIPAGRRVHLNGPWANLPAIGTYIGASDDGSTVDVDINGSAKRYTVGKGKDLDEFWPFPP